jgi:UDP-glucose 4-epimerase
MDKGIALVTGADGFIGRNLVPKLAEIFSEVIALTHNNLLEVDVPNVTNIKMSVMNYEGMEEIISKKSPDVIYNMAGILSDECIKSPLNCFRVNSVGTLNILELSRIHDVQLTVLISSVSVLRRGLPEPAVDDTPLLISNEPYGASKLCAEAISNAYRETYSLKTVSLRYPWIYGYGRKRGGTSFASTFIECAFRKKKFYLPDATGGWLYIDDAIRSLLILLDKGKIKGTYNINGENKSTKEALDIIKEIIPDAKGSIVPLEPNSPINKWVSQMDDSSARRDLGWEQQFSLRDGIIEYIKLLERVKG